MRPSQSNFDAIIVGAGVSGLYLLKRLREKGFSVRILEAGDGVGGVWHWNRYPGTRCDVESMQYSYSFSEEIQQEWSWSERFAPQSELLRYLNHVTDRFDLRRDIQFNTSVTAAHFDEQNNSWSIQTETHGSVCAQFLLLATGCLSVPNEPKIAGMDKFRGKIFHTGRWLDENVDFSGLRVGVVGTGSSGIQSIPVIARQAAHLTVFQRSAHFTVPARNRPLSPDEEAHWKANYPKMREAARNSRSGTLNPVPTKAILEVDDDERRKGLDEAWNRGGLGFTQAFTDILSSDDANQLAADYVRDRIRGIVRDPQTAAALTPTGYPIGGKRLVLNTDYYETFNRDNVSLVNLRTEPFEEMLPNGVRTRAQTYDLDALVFATGYDAMTGAVMKIDIRGVGGATIQEKWEAGPRTYLGLMTAGFPNMFIIAGPGSPCVKSNGITAGEQHAEWLSACLHYLREHAIRRIDANPEAEDRWVEHVNEVATTAINMKADNWYVGANIAGKPRVFMPYVGGVDRYARICNEVAARGYTDFELMRESTSTVS